jgi:hypothetical protein
MGAPHNRERYGEEWPKHRIDAALQELEPLRTSIVLSGGWAWHFMSPEGHPEYKHAHDHKDVDIFVHPNDAAMFFIDLRQRGFFTVRTRFDKPGGNFVRFEKTIEPEEEKPFKITLDVFVGSTPMRIVRDQWRVVEPEYLLGLYKSIHSSGECFAVTAARKLIDEGKDPVNNPKLVEIPK